ncbi:hypothetical protein B0A52_03596 [Exophiala mesophila]|uniref:Xylanolytic transcriptional activator regulatory domain-containing protein n=1 Tax=Exophiala mesophila TaxID=212818 RepID=A0A438N9F8_EXOME|nr:hypothetical protein B0A52_03596 [Exophiala mesophila]
MTGYQDFGGIAARFTLDLARRWSSHDLTSIGSKWAQIEETTAWKYTNAFFEETWEAKLAIVHRDDFEALLREYFRGPAQKGHLAWFALRNTVFACGYRSILVKDPGVSFSEAQVKAGRLFNYALSVLTQILLPPSSLLAIQALTLMACYAEGLGNPALKHFLCSNAVHAAQNKGLHRQPEKSWGISEDEAAKRNGLWWTIYTLEKHLSMCSGRPSAIDDDNVSAYPPAGILSRSDIVPQSLFFATQHAQICSQISRNLLSARSLQLSTPELISTVNHFHQKLMKLLDEIPDELKIGTLARPDHPTPHLIHLLYLHFSIYGSLMVVHTHFFYPWMSSRLNATGAEAAMEGQIRISSTVVAEAARKIILAVRLVTTTVATPSWLAFYYPIYAHINLFIYMLKFPHLSTTAADLGLLDVCAGHFGHIDYLTSAHISISLPRETATLTSKFIKDMKVRSQQPAIQSFHEYPQPHPQAQADTSSQTRTAEDSTINFDEMSNDLPTISDNNDFLNLDAATWNIFSSFDMLTTNETDFRAF